MSRTKLLAIDETGGYFMGTYGLLNAQKHS